MDDRVEVEAQTEDQALDKARDVRDYRDAEITEPELHVDVREKGKVEKSEKVKGIDPGEVKPLDKF